MEKPLKIRMVSVERLMDVLHHLYHMGVDYVDIVGDLSEGQDSLDLQFTEAYMDPECIENFKELDNRDFTSPEQANIKINKLKDSNINDLI